MKIKFRNIIAVLTAVMMLTAIGASADYGAVIIGVNSGEDTVITLNKTDNTVGARAVAAVYNAEDVLLSAVFADEAIGAADTGEISRSFGKLQMPEGGHVKYFVWKTDVDGNLTLEPLAKAFEPTEQPTPTAPTELAGFKATFITDAHASVTVSDTQDFASVTQNVSEVYARSSDTGEILTDGNGQVNFTVVPADGYEVESVTAEPTENYKNLKTPADTGMDNTYRITKVTGDITVTVTTREKVVLPELDAGVISAFRYVGESKVYASNTDGAAPAKISASEDGTSVTALTMVTGTYTDPELEITRSAPALVPAAAWGENPYVQVALSTVGYTNIKVSAKVGATNKGPKSYKLQYSADGESFTDVGDVYSLEGNKTLYKAFDKTALGADAAECEMLYIRIAPVGTETVNGGTLSGASGEFAVNDILIYADASGNPTAPPQGDGIIHLEGDGINADGVENVTVDGSTVTITAAGEYTVEGDLDDGQIITADTLTKDDNIQITLDGVTVSCSTGNALDGQEGKITLMTTENASSFTSVSNSGAKTSNAVYSKRDLTVKGGGALSAVSQYGSGVRCEKDLEIGECDLTVEAANNGIKGDKSVKITKKNKSVTVTSGGDGIKSDKVPESVTDTATGETVVEGGTVTINGGTINITANTTTDADGTVSGGDGIQADSLLTVAGGTLNITAAGDAIKANASSVTDGTPAEGDGCVVISGGTVTASAGEDGIKAVKSVTISDGADITITKAQEGVQVNEVVYAADGTTVQSYVEGEINISGGSVNITCSEDGIQCGTGSVAVSGGSITVNSQQDCLQAENVMNITGGELNLTAHGGAGNTASTSDSCKGVKGGSIVSISGGTLDINTYDDAIHSNNTVRISGGHITAASGDDGVHGDSYLIISGGADINITKSYEGIEAAKIYVQGGETRLVASDDGANAAGEEPTEEAVADPNSVNTLSVSLLAWGGPGGGSTGGWGGGPNWGGEDSSNYGYLEVSGGLLYIEAEGDGFDSNGNGVISGGTVLVNGPTSGGNGVFDVGDGNCTLTITGGTVVGAGTSDMAVTPTAASNSQYYAVKSGLSQSAGSAFTLTSSGGDETVTYVPSKSYKWVLISTPEMTSGSYTFTCGGTVAGGTVTGKDSYGLVTGGTFTGGSSSTVTAKQ